MRFPRLLLASLAAFPLVPVHAADAPAAIRDSAVKVSNWSGYEKLDFKLGGRNALIVKPKKALPGNPWIWRPEFFGVFAQADVALLEKGWHVGYIDIYNMFGSPKALSVMDEYYAHVTKTCGLSKRPVIEGLSRGGLFAFNWTALHPDRVSGLYVDAPVCDFKSWPAGKGKGKGAKSEWAELLKIYGFANEVEALAYKGNPVDNLAPIARAGIPILAVVGDADDVVPVEENIAVVEKRYLALGGKIEVIHKPGVGHHPHGLKDPKPIVDWVMKLAATK